MNGDNRLANLPVNGELKNYFSAMKQMRVMDVCSKIMCNVVVVIKD